jgi:glutathione S-transferase
MQGQDMTKQHTPSSSPILRLHGHAISANARRVMLTLTHLGLPYELVPVNLASPDERAGLRAINPNAKIPVLEHGDFWLWESHAIMQYVAELSPGQLLYPYGPRERADVNRWLFWHNAHFAPPLGVLGYERMWKKFVTGGGPDAALVAGAEQQFAAVAKILDDHLAHREWLATDAMTIADLSIAATIDKVPSYGASLEAFPHVRAHFARVSKLPAWATTEPKPFAPPPPSSTEAARAVAGSR